MPLVRCKKGKLSGWKWGAGNTSCFTYKAGDKNSEDRARRQAMRQGQAIEANKKR